MKYAKHLLVIILIALVLRMAPVALQQMPISYDAPFHFGHAQTIISSQQIPSIEESVEPRPNSYPPLYHLLLAGTSLASGISPIWLAMLLLPIIASLLPLSAFLALRKKNERGAMIAAFIAAVLAPLVITSYDSPANIAFFILPLPLLLIERGKRGIGGLIFGSLLLWNYMIFLVSIVPFVIAMRRDKRALAYAATGIIVSVLLMIILSNAFPWNIHSLKAGMEFTSFNLRNYELVSAGLTLLFVGAILAWSAFRQNGFAFWKAFTLISFLGLVGSFFEVSFRGWEQIKFLGLGTVFLIASIPYSRNLKRYAIVLGTIGLLFSVVFAFQIQYSRISAVDVKAIDYASNNLWQNKKVLAEPSMSGYFSYYTGKKNSVLTSLYFENTSQNSPMPGGLEYLMTQGKKGGNEYLSDSNVQFILLNYEDATARGTAAYAGNPQIDKAFEVGYRENCPFWFLPQAYSCGELEAKVLRFNK
ncbi:MAG: hypothetical protein WC602_07045 [archaeon]